MRLRSKKSESDPCMENHELIVEKSQLEAERMASSSEKEIAMNGIECDMVECVTVGVKNGKESASLDLNFLNSGLKEGINLSPCKVAVKSDNTVDECDVVKVLNDNHKKLSSVVLNNTLDANEKVKVEDMIVFDEGSNAVDENGEGVLGLTNRKRVRKRKVLESSECNRDVRRIGRVLRSNTVVMSDGAKVDEGRFNESVVGFKRQMEAECLDQTEIEKQVIEKRKMAGRPQKKQKRRGRPPKTQGETGCNVNIKAEFLGQNDFQNEVNESTSLTGRQQKKQKSVGRPPKFQGAGQRIQKNKHKDMVNLKRRGRPPKRQEGNLINSLTNAKKATLLVVKKNNNQLKEDVKESSKLHNVQIEDGLSEIITGDSKEKVKASKESNDHTTAKETVKNQSSKQLKNSIGGVDRRKEQQLVRDQIISMIMKAGWTIEYRKRLTKEYLDAVYVDQDGKTHWSITKAYFSLKKKIDNGDASIKEVSAFTPIPDDEMNLLFRAVSKVRSDKNQKKKKIGKKNARKADIIISGEAELKRHKKKPGKKGKDGTKKKVTRGPKVTQKGRQSRKPRLVARSTCKGSDQGNDDCTLYSGKRNLLSWMIGSGVITLGGKLQYGEGRNGFLEGVITHEGIRCSCCNEIIDISSFVAHGKGSKFPRGFGNISLQSGLSLVKCLLQSWRKEEESSCIRFNYVDVDVEGEDPSDDTCNMCGDGGDLICCDGCPSTFHQSCLDIQNFPSGDWRCTYCSCKFCGLVADGAFQMDDSHHAPDSVMFTCCLCEEKFHRLCLEEDDVEVDSSTILFCGRKCQEIHDQLRTYLGVEFELEDGFSWTLLKRSDVSQVIALDDQWKVECNSKLAVAFSVMDECFEPIMDERSGTNMIQNVVYSCGSNFRRLNYSGFYTAILERGGEMISAASIRIHGHRLAEMPFIGTRNMYRRQGMCRRLLDAIEHALSSLGVGELVIPAIPELYKTWTMVFGFKPLEESKRQAMKCMSMILFPGTDMLRKTLVKNQFAKKNVSPVAVSDDKTLGCITVVNDDNVHLETKSSNAIDSASEEEATDLESAKLIKPSSLTSKIVPKNTFDLNLQPGATDSDIQPIDDSSISRDQQVCKISFEPSDSRAQVDINATQPLVLV